MSNENEVFERSEAELEDAGYKKFKTDLFDWIQCIVPPLIICILLFVFCARNVGIVGGSMENTLINGDSVVISNLFYTPKQGDIVVLQVPSFQDEPIVKRIIALEGQTVDIDFDLGVVYVDGVALEESYAKTPTNRSLDFEKEITVPEGCVFVLGDNRNASTDSRSSSIGCVDERHILGRVLFRIMPISKFGTVN